jgi:hypothetical protein
MSRRVGYRIRWAVRRSGVAAGLIAVVGLLGLAATAVRVPRADAALPSYVLFFKFDLPLTLPAVVMTDEGAHSSYTGTMRGTLGGLPVQAATYTYGTDVKIPIGGGTFILTTAAGEVRDGEMLVSSDGQATTLLFFGVYLGTRLEFSIHSDRPQAGGMGVTVSGLARTGFANHDEYMAAIRKAVASLPEGDRQKVLAQADINPRLVNDYQRH